MKINILKPIFKYAWIFAALIVIVLFFYFSKNMMVEAFNCGSIYGQQDCKNNNQCSWQFQKGSRVSKPHYQCVNK